MHRVRSKSPATHNYLSLKMLVRGTNIFQLKQLHLCWLIILLLFNNYIKTGRCYTQNSVRKITSITLLRNYSKNLLLHTKYHHQLQWTLNYIKFMPRWTSTMAKVHLNCLRFSFYMMIVDKSCLYNSRQEVAFKFHSRNFSYRVYNLPYLYQDFLLGHSSRERLVISKRNKNYFSKYELTLVFVFFIH